MFIIDHTWWWCVYIMNAQYHADCIGFNVTCPNLNSEDPCTTSDKVPCTSVNVWPCQTTDYPHQSYIL